MVPPGIPVTFEMQCSICLNSATCYIFSRFYINSDMATHGYTIQANEDDDDLGITRLGGHDSLYSIMTMRHKHFPKAIGVVEVVMGFILTLLGW